jgi:hypothetical protein
MSKIGQAHHRAWELLLDRINQKTSWGRVQLQELMLGCLVEARGEVEGEFCPFCGHRWAHHDGLRCIGGTPPQVPFNDQISGGCPCKEKRN